MMSRKYISIASLLCFSFLAQSVAAEDLMAIYDLALENDPIFQQAQAYNQSAQEVTKQTRAALLPSIDLRANTSRSETDNVTFDSDGYEFTLSQTIYDRGKWANHSAAQHGQSQSNAEFKSARQEIILYVAQVYFRVLRAIDNLAFAKAEKEANARQLDQTKQRFDVGLVAITDVHESQSSYDRSVASFIAAENDLDGAKEALREITGKYHDQLKLLDKKAPLIKPEPNDIDHWTRLALDNNTDLLAAQLQLKQAEDNVSFQRAQYQPRIILNAGYASSDSDAPDAINSDGTSISLNLAMNLFASGATNAAVNQAQHELRAAKAYLEQQTRSTQRAARNAFLGAKAGISRVKALGQAVVSSESALRASEAGFEVGTRTTVDVLISRRALFSSQADYAGARYDYIIQMLELKRAAGELSAEDLRQINNWLTQ